MENTERFLPTHIVSAGAIVLNDRGDILLVKDDRRGTWSFPGGIIEEGEGVLDGVKREVLEETGITVEVGELFCVTSNTCKYPGYNGVKVVPTKVMLDFVCRATGGAPRPSEENSQTAWCPLDEAQKRITAPAIAVRFQAYLEYEGRPAFLEYKTKPAFELEQKRTI
jgi:ADP-ribose pyrophosphatase YjhB (NUDIX family)